MKIAERTLTLLGKDDVEIELHAPEKEADGVDFNCRYIVSGLEKKIDKRALGVDSLQALTLAIQMLKTDLQQCREKKDGELSWFASADLGLQLR